MIYKTYKYRLYPSKVPKGWVCSVASDVVTCQDPSLTTGNSINIAIYVTVKKTAPLTTYLSNTAAVSSHTVDPVATNNTAAKKRWFPSNRAL